MTEPASNQTVCLIDGSSYLYRAFHALPSLTSGDGKPTGALFGVANMIRRLLETHQPDGVVVVFDAPGKNFRHELFAEYKANRPRMPDELREQIEPLKALIDALGVHQISVDGVEADDVIATLAAQAERARCKVLISSGDKDLAQLVNDRVVLEDSMQDKRYDAAAVEQKFGVGPDRVGDWLALTGDASDNIPGVEKVGPKTASKWLAKYDSLQGVIDHADEVGGKVGENLRSALEQLPTSRKLVELKRDVELQVTLDQIPPAQPELERLTELLRQHGFSTWLRQLEDSPETGAEPADMPLEVSTVTSRAALESLLEQLRQAEVIAFDTETTSLEPLDAELVGFSFAVEPHQAFYVPLRHVDQVTEFDAEEAIGILKPLLEDAERPKLAQHTKYDLNVLAQAGIQLAGVAHDSMLQSYCFNATATRHDLDSLANRYLGRSTTSYEQVAGKGKQQVTFDQVSVDVAAEYAGEDAEVCLALHHKLWPEIQRYPGVKMVYETLEIPLIQVLARMERTGVMIDAERLAQHSEELAGRLQTIEQDAWQEAGGEFNLGSPKQLQEILFERLDIPVVRKTPKGQPSTAEDVLQELAGDYALPRLILEHRSLSKLKSTYTDRLPEKIHPRTGRIHTHYHQAVAATGRLSSADPNLQNIPIRTEQGRRIRKAFVAPEGWTLLAADYSQIELRIMAHLSGDERLLDAFSQGEDVHQATAAEVFGVQPDQVSSDQRRAAKAINFGLMYGMSAWGLAKQLETDRDQAAEYIERYFQRYPGVRAFMDKTRKIAHDQGFVETLFGRRLWLQEIKSRNRQRQQAAERAAINAPLQGTAADIIKRAMIDVDDWIQADGVAARLVMQVHDELVLEVRDDALESVQQGVIERMAAAAELDVELLVEAGTGQDWDSAH